METYVQHKNLAHDRFELAREQFEEENYHTAAHLFINAVISYHNALCQKKLHKIPYHKSHDDSSYFNELQSFLGIALRNYKDDYSFLMRHKNQADYGTEMSQSLVVQIKRKAEKIKNIIEPLL